MTEAVRKPTQITRDNLIESISAALQLAQQRQELRGSSPHDEYFGRLAVESLSAIRAQLALPAEARQKLVSSFGAQFVRVEPEFDRDLASIVMKIEDVYRRWYRYVEAL